MNSLSHRAFTVRDPRVWAVPAAAVIGLALLAPGDHNAAVFHLLNAFGGESAIRAWSVIGVLGDGVVALSLCLLLARLRPELMRGIVLAILLTAVSVQVGKRVHDVPRPLATSDSRTVQFVGPQLRHGAFPSGHAATAFMLAGISILGFGLRRASWLPLALALVVALARVVIGAHWPIDVLAGALLGWCAAALGIEWSNRSRLARSAGAYRLMALLLSAFPLALLAGYETQYPVADWLARAIGALTLGAFLLPLHQRGDTMDTARPSSAREPLFPPRPPSPIPPRISIVIPVYDEAANLEELVRRIGAAMRRGGTSFELICVDDGSRDASASLLARLAQEHEWLRPICLIRNYGQSVALQAGFDHVRGELVVTLDGDLQNEPDDIPRLIAIMDAQPDIDLISGWRKERKDAVVSRKLPSVLANALISAVTKVHLHDYGCGLKLYRAPVIRDIRLYGELHRFIPALAAEVGARILEVPVTHHARTRGSSKYGIGRTFRVLLDLLWVKFLLRFLHRPMHAFGSMGIVLVLAGFGILAYLAVDKLVLGNDIGGRPLLMLGVLLSVIGAQIVATGLLGELLTRIYHEPQGRRLYVLRAPARPRPQRADETVAS
jgi:glycosyltransferase involved in cell wall biosynthesis/membrane-associated phospholipid phosphatase